MILIGYINGRPAFVKAGYKLDSLGEFLQTKQTKKPVSKLHARQGKPQSPGNSNFYFLRLTPTYSYNRGH